MKTEGPAREGERAYKRRGTCVYERMAKFSAKDKASPQEMGEGLESVRLRTVSALFTQHPISMTCKGNHLEQSQIYAQAD